MKKVVRLTESDLVRLVKRVINEQGFTNDAQTQPVNLTSQQKDSLMKKLIMDFQKSNSLGVDGIVNTQTYGVLLKKGYIS